MAAAAYSGPTAAWSPEDLHPWATPPDAGLAAEAAPELWLKHQLLPLRVERTPGRQELVVAAATADVDPEALLRLRRAVRMPVRLAPAAADDVEFWTDVVIREDSWH